MIITGCQRTGTKSLSLVFSYSHEVQFNPDTKICPMELKPECSWMAQPFARSITSFCPVLHLTRNPLDNINSLIETWEPKYKLYTDFIYRYLPGLKNIKNTLIKSVLYYIQWNEELMGLPRIKIESFYNIPKNNKRKHDNLTWEQMGNNITPKLWSKLLTLGELLNYKGLRR